jgi:hypothetical protein
MRGRTCPRHPPTERAGGRVEGTTAGIVLKKIAVKWKAADEEYVRVRQLEVLMRHRGREA